MGRGRAKAKQTKVARELKYSSPTTDFDNLRRELSGDPTPARRPVEEDPPPRWSEDSRWSEDEDDSDR